MATVSCPQCKRALNLPDDRDFEVVSCPLCHHVFTPPQLPRVVAAPIPMPTERIEPSFAWIPEPDPESEKEDTPPRSPLADLEDEDYPTRSHRGKGRHALESAGVWLRIMAWIGLCTTLPCCGSTVLLMSQVDFARSSKVFPVVLIVLTLAYLFILNTVGSMQQHKSHDLAMATVSVGLLTTSGLILLNLPLLFKVIGIWRGPLPIIEDTCCGGFFILPSWVVILCGLIGGIKGMLVLIQPGARELFRSSRAE